MDTLKVYEFFLFKYDMFHWIGMIIEIDNVEQDFMLNLCTCTVLLLNFSGHLATWVS